MLGLLSNKKRQFWFAQTLGWFSYYFLIYLLSGDEEPDPWALVQALVVLGISGVAITSLYRLLIIKLDWFRYRFGTITFLVVISSFVLGSIFMLVRWGVLHYILKEELTSEVIKERYLFDIVNGAFIFFLWSAMYFIYHYVEKARGEEIKNLQWEASRTEIELKNLKAQLNPHFMFNSMNSIRALIDEDPSRAKFAITQLSSILRNTLLMGKSKTVTLREELAVVKDYLSLEGIRYEERLRVSYDIDDQMLNCEIPPMMIQTIVENAIKHGISKLPRGGDLKIRVIDVDPMMEVIVANSGNLDKGKSRLGIGLSNTRKRLDLLYNGNFEFDITSHDSQVITRICLPKNANNESNPG